jgi:DNA-binding transcriptional ArsR family regulator
LGWVKSAAGLTTGNSLVTNVGVDAFEALADPVRRALLAQLVSGPARVVDLAEHHPVSRPAISRHLLGLAAAGLVTADDVGRERHYRLRAAGLDPVAALLRELRPPAPPVPAASFDALDLEVRRTGRERARTQTRQKGTA